MEIVNLFCPNTISTVVSLRISKIRVNICWKEAPGGEALNHMTVLNAIRRRAIPLALK